MPKNSSAARRTAARGLAAAENITYTAALRRMEQSADVSEPDHYFVALTRQGLGRFGNGATVRDGRTGRTTALIPAPAQRPFASVTAAAAPGVFFLTVDPVEGDEHRDLYRLRVDDAGSVAELISVPGLPDVMSDRVAITPDGARLAVSDQSSAGVAVVTLATGERRVLTTTADGTVDSLSWAADGQTLAFEWSPAGYGPHSVRVVDTGTAKDLIADSRDVTGINHDLGLWVSPLISDDGGQIYVTVAQPEPAGGPHWTRLLGVPVGTGSRPGTLLEMRFEPMGHNGVFMWTTICRDVSGPRLLAFSPGYAHRVDLATGDVTRLPFPEGDPHAAAW